MPKDFELGVKVLDEGYVKLIESWGSDERIIEAARMSTGKGFQGWGPLCPKCDKALVLDLVETGMRESQKTFEPVCPEHGVVVPMKPGDEKLLGYLWRNRHTTPFEQCGFSIEVQAPIVVFREWHRHRTQCLVGSTMITCVTPTGTTFKRTIKEIFELKHGGVVDHAPAHHKNGYSKAGTPVLRAARRKDAWRTRILPNCQHRVLRVLNEDTGEFTTAKMAKVWESGSKPVFRISTKSGRYVIASAEHPFFTKDGWKKLKTIKPGTLLARLGKIAAFERPIPPALRTGIGVWTSMMRSRMIVQPKDRCYLCNKLLPFDCLELDHVVPVAADILKALDAANLKPICERCHANKSAAEQPSRLGMTKRGIRWDEVVSVEPAGTEMTYDIEVDGPHHNFVANDFVVHNSYNEFSARYAQMPNMHYVPTLERIKESGGANKQAQGVAPLAADEDIQQWLKQYEWLQAQIYSHYEYGLSLGIPKEVARLNTPVSRYSKMCASTNLLNWLRFLGLRQAKNAQYEIRKFAEVIGEIVALRFPRTWALFQEQPI